MGNPFDLGGEPTPYDKMQDEHNMRIACAHLTKDLLVAGAVGGEKPTIDDLVDGAKRLHGWVTAHDSKFDGADAKASDSTASS